MQPAFKKLLSIPEVYSDFKCEVCLVPFDELEEFEETISCGHVFHKLCFTTWTTLHKNKCPRCKTKISAEELSKMEYVTHMTQPFSEFDSGAGHSTNRHHFVEMKMRKINK